MTSSFEGNPGGQIPENYLFSSDNDLSFRDLASYLTDMAYSLNRKDSGYFLEEEVVTGQQFVPVFGTSTSSSVQYRSVLRMTVDFGSLPNTGTKSVAHGISGISSSYTLTRLYGAATDPSAPAWIPIPYASPTGASNIELDADGTNVNITTGSDRTAFTRCFVVLEYIQTT